MCHIEWKSIEMLVTYHAMIWFCRRFFSCVSILHKIAYTHTTSSNQTVRSTWSTPYFLQGPQLSGKAPSVKFDWVVSQLPMYNHKRKTHVSRYIVKLSNKREILSYDCKNVIIQAEKAFTKKLHVRITFKNIIWQRWDSNPRLRKDWCLKPAP